MRVNARILIFFTIILSSCAQSDWAPISKSHPAHPDALTGPKPLVSQTLVYSKADIPSPLPDRGATADRRGEATGEARGPGAASTSAPQTVVGEGSVVAVVPSSSQIVLDHGTIKNFMDAMTMGYRVESPALLEGLKQGDKVRFTIEVEKKAITKVEKIN